MSAHLFDVVFTVMVGLTVVVIGAVVIATVVTVRRDTRAGGRYTRSRSTPVVPWWRAPSGSDSTPAAPAAPVARERDAA